MIANSIIDPKAWRTESDRQKLVESWGDWINGDWSHYLNLTVSHQAIQRFAAKFGARLSTEEFLLHQYPRWIRHLNRRAQKHVGSFWVIERGLGGRPHIHGFTHGTKLLNSRELEESWRDGRGVVDVFDSSRGAADYIVKDIGGTIIHYDITAPSRHFRITRSPHPAGN